MNQNSGLIGWVPNCDTLHTLIRDYREKKNILLSLEHKLMQAFATEVDQLTVLQKVQVPQLILGTIIFPNFHKLFSKIWDL